MLLKVKVCDVCSGKSPLWASDNMPFTTLMYGNGPGSKMEGGKRPDIRKVDTSKTVLLFIDQPAAVFIDQPAAVFIVPNPPQSL